MIFKGIREEEKTWKSCISGAIQIATLTIMIFLLYSRLPNVWLLEMALVETISVWAGLEKYLGDESKKGNLAGVVMLYIGLWIGLLSLFHYSGQSLVGYTYGKDWSEYSSNALMIAKNAVLFGTSPALQENPELWDFLLNRKNYILSSLYYYGWIFTAIVIAALILFVVVTGKMLGNRKNRICHRNYVAYLITTKRIRKQLMQKL